jgi:hypothetical protein
MGYVDMECSFDPIKQIAEISRFVPILSLIPSTFMTQTMYYILSWKMPKIKFFFWISIRKDQTGACQITSPWYDIVELTYSVYSWA